MINQIIAFSVRQRLWILALIIGFFFAGWAAFSSLPIDAVPDITNVQVQILTKSPALGPLEVEELITTPVEIAMTGLPDIEELRSVSRAGISAVTVVFKESMNIYFARQLVQERLIEAREKIPEGLGEPEMGPATTGLGEIYHFAVEGPQTPLELRTLLDWQIAPRLRTVSGIVEVNTWGGYAKRFEVVIQPEKLASYKISLKKVFEAITENNAVAGSASIERFDEQLLIKSDGLVRSIQDLEEIIVELRDSGTPIRVKDLAQVREGYLPRLGAATIDGQRETVIGMAQMRIGENSRAVAKRVDEKIREIQKSLPEKVVINSFYDRTALVNRTLHTVQKNLIEGGLLVIAVLFLLLRDVRAGLVVALIIPLSMIFAAIGMRIGGLSGNLMSLGAIDFGLIVDGAVIVIENCMRRLSEARKELNRDLTRSEHDEIIRGASTEMQRPTLFGVFIILIVYLPILALQGVEGKMFRPMAITVGLALIGSLIFTVTAVPALASFFLKRNLIEKEVHWLENLKKRYSSALAWALNRSKALLLSAAGCFVAALALFAVLGGEFIPSLDEGDIALQAWRLPSVSMKSSVQSTLRIEKVLMQFPEVKTVVSRTGSPEIATDVMGIELSDIFVILKPKSEWKTKSKEQLVEKMSDALSREIPEAGFGFTQPIEMRFNELIAGVRSDVAVKIFGSDLNVLKEKGEQVGKILTKIKGARDVKAEQIAGLPFLEIVPDRKNLARYGVNMRDLLNTVEAIKAGHFVGMSIQGVARFPIAVKFGEGAEMNVERIRRLPVYNQRGQSFPLGQVSEIKIVSGPAQISRELGQRRMVVEANIRGRDIESFVKEAQKNIDKELKLPAGYYIEWGGTFKQLNEARKRLSIVVPVSLVVIFALLVIATGSSRLAFIIFSGIPLAAIGGILALAVRGIPFSISAGVGFIALFGVAVLNGLVLVSSIQRLINEKSLDDAVKEGALLRFRPVLMTALVASLGFVPMAFSHGAGAEVQRPLATVVIGGLISSTFLTLFILPILYRRFAPSIKQP